MAHAHSNVGMRLATVALWLVVTTQAWGDDLAKTATRPQSSPSVMANAPTPEPIAESAPLTDAERIARLQRSIDEDGRLLKELRDKLDAPESEYAQADRDFSQIDGQLESKKKELQQTAATQPQADLNALEAELGGLETKRKLAKERFDLAIRERKTLQEQLATLEKKLQQDQEALSKLKGQPLPPPATRPAGVQATNQPAEPTASQPVSPLAAPAANEKTTLTPASPAGDGGMTPTPASGILGAAKPGESTPGIPAGKSASPPSPELQTARTEAAHKQVQAQEAAKEARSATERMEAARKAIALEQNLLQTTRERADNAQQTERTLYDELQTKWQAGASRNQLEELRKKIGEARARSWDAERDIREGTDRIATLQTELSAIQSEQLAAAEQAEQKRKEAESAHKRVEQLENPWSPQNLLRWFLQHGPRLAGIVIAMVVLLWLSRLTKGRIIRFMSCRAQHGTHEDQENRAQTLVGVFRSAAAVAIYTGGTLMLLTEIGVNIIPLMGGAAVIGLAVAFGAQNLIRDYFSGFMILLENQYTINDVVKLGDIAGQVENITLRVTVLRGLDGTVHFVPNGQIAQVSNLTHGWSRALFDIPVSYKTDVDQVMEILVELGKELRRGPDFRGMILEMPEMLGVDEFGDSAIVIKFFIKTKPLKQWTVKREMLRRIKRKFDELGIEIPFPQRTIYHRIEEDSPLSHQLAAWATEKRESGVG